MTVVVIFESWPKPEGGKKAYLDIAGSLMPLVQDVDGFISVERFQSVADENKMVAISFWRDEDAVKNWRNVLEHRRVQAGSRKTVFDNYRLRIANVTRDYTMKDRKQAPDDSMDVIG
jgi:heme-degrading monooxygenase HmoA